MGKLKNILKKLRDWVDDDNIPNNKPVSKPNKTRTSHSVDAFLREQVGQNSNDDDDGNGLDSRTVTFGNPSNNKEARDVFSTPKHPADATYFEICTQSYLKKDQRAFVVRQYWRYLKNYSTDTVCAYLGDANGVILLCYRGTKPTYLPDLIADKNIAFNKLSETGRFKEDVTTTEKLLKDFPASDFSYFLCGHSLGQAMYLEMDRTFNKFSYGGRGFNGALQPKDIVYNPKKFHYWYIKGDPLYRLSGRFLLRNLLVFPQASEKTLQNHDLANFQGLTKQDALKSGGSKSAKKQAQPPKNKELNQIGFPSNIQKYFS
jgi:hypothetical protein